MQENVFVVLESAPPIAVIFKLTGMTDELMKQVNELCHQNRHTLMLKRCRLIKESCSVAFYDYGVDGRSRCKIFWDNLDLINSRLPFVMAYLVEDCFFGNNQKVLISESVARLVYENPLGLKRPELKYPYMVKELLYCIYRGMTADKLWDGRRTSDNTLDEVAYVDSCVYDKCYLTYNWFCDYGLVYKEHGEYFLKIDYEIMASAR